MIAVAAAVARQRRKLRQGRGEARMKKKIIGLLLCAVLVMSSGMSVCAAGFDMEYLPGTGDTVTNMPDADSGVGGQPYTVSSDVPARTGYEFLYWTLDYGIADTYTLKYQVTGDPEYGKPDDAAEPAAVTGIPAGGSVKLADAPVTKWVTSDGSPAPTTETYRVNYLEQGTDRVLAPQKVVPDQAIGITVTESAIDIDGYVIIDPDTQDLTIKREKTGKWTFTGWCRDEACTMPVTEVTNINADTTVYGRWEYEVIDLARNEIYFYYKNLPPVLYTDYIVRYIYMDTGEQLIPDVKREHYEIGSTQTEYAPEIKFYKPLIGYESITFEVKEGKVVEFIYYHMDM